MSPELPTWLRAPWLVRLGQIVIGVVFAWAALAKIGDPRGFAAQVHNFQLVPVAAENLVAVTLPWIELVAALALLLGIRARAGAWTALGMLALFTLAIGWALARGLDIECGCFGTADGAQVGWSKVGQNLVLLGLALVATQLPHDAARRSAPIGSERLVERP